MELYYVILESHGLTAMLNQLSVSLIWWTAAFVAVANAGGTLAGSRIAIVIRRISKWDAIRFTLTLIDATGSSITSDGIDLANPNVIGATCILNAISLIIDTNKTSIGGWVTNTGTTVTVTDTTHTFVSFVTTSWICTRRCGTHFLGIVGASCICRSYTGACVYADITSIGGCVANAIGTTMNVIGTLHTFSAFVTRIWVCTRRCSTHSLVTGSTSRISLG